MLPPLDPNRLATLSAAAGDMIDCALDRTERTNLHRVREADALLKAFHALTGVDPSPDADGPDTALADLLAHLMHWAEAQGVDFDECLRLGRGYHGDEVSDEAPHEPDLAERHEAEQALVSEEWRMRHG